MRQRFWICLFLAAAWIKAAPVDSRLPSLIPDPPYVASQACKTCHPKEHASWHRTYHRTMTQVATPESVAGSFDGTTIESDGLAYRVFKKEGELKAEMPDPDVMMYIVQGGMKTPFSKVPRIELPVVMSTGSHHYQTYWVASKRYEGLLQTLPLVYLLEDKRWVPREAAFLRGPADRGRIITQWNHHCIRCHSTAGNPGLDDATGMLKSRVAELGISCEACHGPGQPHVEKQTALLRDAKESLESKTPGRDTSIVNPSLLDHRRSSQVCGQCHGVYVTRDEFAMKFAREGPLYRPGEDLDLTRHYVQHPRANPNPENAADFQRNTEFYRERWWDDGSILAGGREYTALIASRCYTKGEISCVSCHSMHRSDPADQLKSGMDSPAACVGCHQEPKYNQEISKHTFHTEGSTGSNCLNCHMPHTTYALFKAIRSHQISSPTVEASMRFGTPNACNLCHLDKTLAWTQTHLTDRYHAKAVVLSEEHQRYSSVLLWTLKGNAIQRVIAAWHLGWEPAQKTAGKEWLAPFLAELLQDSYGVVRYVAARSLRTLPGFKQFEYDFLAPEKALQQFSSNARKAWQSFPLSGSKAGESALLLRDGRVDERKLREILLERDDRSVTIQE